MENSRLDDAPLQTRDNEIGACLKSFINSGNFTFNENGSNKTRIVYIQEVYPSNLSMVELKTNSCISDSVSIETPYKGNFLGVFGGNDSRANVSVVCIDDSGKQEYDFYVSVSQSPSVYKTFFVVRNDRQGTDQEFQFKSILMTMDHLDYGYSIKDYSDSMKTNNIKKLSNLYNLNSKLINQTESVLNYTDRLNNLQNLRPEILDGLVHDTINLYNISIKLRNLDDSLRSLKKSDESVLGTDYLSSSVIFKNEIVSLTSDISRNNEALSSDLEKIKAVQGDIKQVYYSELDSARAEQDRTENNQNNVYVILLAILTILISVLTTIDNLVFDDFQIKSFINLFKPKNVKSWRLLLFGFIVTLICLWAFWVILNVIFALNVSIVIYFVGVAIVFFIFSLTIYLLSKLLEKTDEEGQLQVINKIKAIILIVGIGFTWQVLFKIKGYDLVFLIPSWFVVFLVVIIFAFTKKKTINDASLLQLKELNGRLIGLESQNGNVKKSQEKTNELLEQVAKNIEKYSINSLILIEESKTGNADQKKLICLFEEQKKTLNSIRDELKGPSERVLESEKVREEKIIELLGDIVENTKRPRKERDRS